MHDVVSSLATVAPHLSLQQRSDGFLTKAPNAALLVPRRAQIEEYEGVPFVGTWLRCLPHARRSVAGAVCGETLSR
jgi:hypothetical protein